MYTYADGNKIMIQRSRPSRDVQELKCAMKTND